MTVYIRDTKYSIRELLQLINPAIKVAGYKSNSKRLVVFLYTTDEWTEKEIGETTSFTKATNNIKYLQLILSKQVKNLYDKNFKSLKKKLKKISED